MSRTRDRIIQLLKDADTHGATELHFKVPQKPLYRVDSDLYPGNHPTLTPQDLKDLVYGLGDLASRELSINSITDERFSFGLAGVGRFQASVYRQRGSLAITIRKVPVSIPTLEELGFDQRVHPVIGRSGLMLIAGGKGRSNLVNSLVKWFNENRRGYIVLVEDQLTVLHRDGQSFMAHREVGFDVDSYAHAIKVAIKHGADLIAVNQIDDAETADAALWAAEHGVAVIGCVPASNAADAPWFVTRNFEGDRRVDSEKRVKRVLHSILTIPTLGRPEIVLPKQPQYASKAQSGGQIELEKIQ